MTETPKKAEKPVKIFIKDETHFKDLAKETSKVVINNYGYHNAFEFLEELKKQLIIN